MPLSCLLIKKMQGIIKQDKIIFLSNEKQDQNMGGIMYTVVLCFVTLFLATIPAGTQFAAAYASETEKFTELRRIMVERDLKGRDITDPKVLEVMGSVKRHEFVPKSLRNKAYNDYPLPIARDRPFPNHILWHS